MKTLKFPPHLVPMILEGAKTVTWRLFDDKHLSTGDQLDFINKGTGEQFASAVITNIRTKRLGDITEEDYNEGHEQHKDQVEMLATFRGYYGDRVNMDSLVKIVYFDLIK